MKKSIKFSLMAAITFQFFVLSGMYILSASPLWTGTEVKIKTLPVDPRSLFRGNYAKLNYDISEIKGSSFSDSNITQLRRGEVVFVSLKKSENDLYVFERLSLIKPNTGIFIRGRTNRRFHRINGNLKVKYGIEAFFAPKEKAIALENDLRDGAVAVLMIDGNGKARIKEIIEQ